METSENILSHGYLIITEKRGCALFLLFCFFVSYGSKQKRSQRDRDTFKFARQPRKNSSMKKINKKKIDEKHVYG